MSFHKGQSLNDWVEMLHTLYGGSQNYAKTPFEIHAHLTEVCGVFGKQLFKKGDLKTAATFLPKMFAWAIALFRKVHPTRADLEEVILRKFPNACGYCLKRPCICWKGSKPSLDELSLRDLYYKNALAVRRSVNDFQLMFKEIYEASWSKGKTKAELIAALQILFVRLIEELAEVGEAVRFHHLYPENFENEVADFLAWWFATLSTLASAEGNEGLAEDILWRTYPAMCLDCQLLPCLCRPGPVRQLMSRPIPGQHHRFDSLTAALNQAAYNEDIKQAASGQIVLGTPASCARIDVDKFKTVNDSYGHAAGDEALRHIASVLRRTVRERDRVYRIGGDEFGVLFTSYTEEEAAGTMRRACSGLRDAPVRWVGKDGVEAEFTVSISVGVAEIGSSNALGDGFELADKAAYTSKEAGRGRVTRASQIRTPDPA